MQEEPQSSEVKDLLAEAAEAKSLEQIEELERVIARMRHESLRTKAIHAALQKKYDTLAATLEIMNAAGEPAVYEITPSRSKGDVEAAVIMVASDWHVEEIVEPGSVNNLNEYNPEISERRAQKFFRSGMRLTNIMQKDVRVGTIVLPLLGDFITNDIHPELAENNAQLPVEAIMTAQSYIASGIAFLLEHFDGKLVIPCHSGNHGRTTHKVHMASEHGHSLEFFMYQNLAKFFRSEDRVYFEIPQAYHSYLRIYDQTVRFHHGHSILFYGGVGGIYIPVNKAISQWNQAHRADLDIFGHFHQMRDGHRFLSNGSLIGYNAFGLRIKAEYEPPRQAFTVIDNKHGRTATWPILVDRRETSA